jgi:DNA-binding transcriptional MerR regulator
MTPSMPERTHLSIREVLEILVEEFPDVSISKIRYFESRGLIRPERTPAGYRRFYQTDVERLRWILRQQRDNYLPLEVIRGRLEQDTPYTPSLFESSAPYDEPPGIGPGRGVPSEISRDAPCTDLPAGLEVPAGFEANEGYLVAAGPGAAPVEQVPVLTAHVAAPAMSVGALVGAAPVAGPLRPVALASSATERAVGSGASNGSLSYANGALARAGEGRLGVGVERGPAASASSRRRSGPEPIAPPAAVPPRPGTARPASGEVDLPADIGPADIGRAAAHAARGVERAPVGGGRPAGGGAHAPERAAAPATGGVSGGRQDVAAHGAASAALDRAGAGETARRPSTTRVAGENAAADDLPAEPALGRPATSLSGNRASDGRASDDRGPDDRGPDDFGPGNRASGGRGPGDRGPGGRASDRAPGDRASDDRAPDGDVSGGDVSDGDASGSDASGRDGSGSGAFGAGASGAGGSAGGVSDGGVSDGGADARERAESPEVSSAERRAGRMPADDQSARPAQRAHAAQAVPAGRSAQPVAAGGPTRTAEPAQTARSASPPRSSAATQTGPAPRAAHRLVTGASFSGEELATAAGVEAALIDELLEYGLITGRDVAGVRVYDESALLVTRVAAAFRRFGIESRHLKSLKHAAEREAGLYAQVVTPLLRQRNPQSHERAVTELAEMAELGASLRAHFLQAELRQLTGG